MFSRVQRDTIAIDWAFNLEICTTIFLFKMCWWNKEIGTKWRWTLHHFKSTAHCQVLRASATRSEDVQANIGQGNVIDMNDIRLLSWSIIPL